MAPLEAAPRSPRKLLAAASCTGRAAKRGWLACAVRALCGSVRACVCVRGACACACIQRNRLRRAGLAALGISLVAWSTGRRLARVPDERVDGADLRWVKPGRGRRRLQDREESSGRRCAPSASWFADPLGTPQRGQPVQLVARTQQPFTCETYGALDSVKARAPPGQGRASALTGQTASAGRQRWSGCFSASPRPSRCPQTRWRPLTPAGARARAPCQGCHRPPHWHIAGARPAGVAAAAPPPQPGDSAAARWAPGVRTAYPGPACRPLPRASLPAGPRGWPPPRH